MSDIALFARYLILVGGLRFVIEFVRVNKPLVGPFTLAQMFSVAVIFAGLVVMRRSNTR
jgi:prolipoprotein diacylglyceryltransferase